MAYRLAKLHRDGPPALSGAEDWPGHRMMIMRRWTDVLGRLPTPGAVSFEAETSIDCGSHARVSLRIATGDGDIIPALLLMPHDISSPRAAVLALHPTSPMGKDSVATEDGPDHRRYGLELAERGYIVLAPDTITAGERVGVGEQRFVTADFDRVHPELSAVGKMISDHRHCLDALASLAEVDERRLGAIGHSLGGYNAFFLAGMDDRVAATVSSCGFGTFAGDPEPHRWGQRDWFSHLPALSPMIDNGQVPFEMHEIVALSAPRPFFNWMGTEDQIFPHWRQAVMAMQHLGRLYEGLGVDDRFVSLLGHGGHDFPPLARAAAYAFLDHHLGHGGEDARAES